MMKVMRNLEGAGVSIVSIIAFIIIMAILGRMYSSYKLTPSTSDDNYTNGGNFMVPGPSRF